MRLLGRYKDLAQRTKNRAGKTCDRGFSLVEVLIVMVIIGLISGLAVMNMPPPTDVIETKLKRLTAQINAAAERAIINGNSTAFGVTQGGYQIFQYQDQNWQSMATGLWDEGNKNQAGHVEIELEKQGNILPLSSDSRPQIIFEPTGIYAPFVIKVGKDQISYTITSQDDGSVVFNKSQS